MNGALVFLDRFVGVISRWEIGGQLRRTHEAIVPDDFERPVLFDREFVDRFRTHPEGRFYIGGPAPVPGGNDQPPGAPAMALAA